MKIHHLLIPCLLGSTAVAGEIESIEAIRAAVENEAYRSIELDDAVVRVGRIDRRLRLPACGEALETHPGPGGIRLGRVSIAVRCDGAHPWSLYVPATISVHRSVVVAARPLARGKILTADDLSYKKMELKRASHRYFTDKQALIGRQLTRRVASGAPLRANQARLPVAVKRGMRVIIHSSLPGLRVSMRGKALEEGRVGDRIRVLNSRSGRKLDAVVLAAGKVQIMH